MTLEVWILVVAVFSLFAGVVGAWATVYYGRSSSRSQEEQSRSQEEQLRLQREQSTMVPDLKVSRVRFLDPHSVEEVQDTMEEVEKRKQEEEERRKGTWNSRPHIYSMDPWTLEQRDYEGPEPDAVMEIELENEGRIAAHDVSGTISMKRAPLEILDFPGLDASEVSDPDETGIVTAEVGTISEILPGRRESFRVGIEVHPEPHEDAKLKYDFITPAGFPTSGEWVVPFKS